MNLHRLTEVDFAEDCPTTKRHPRTLSEAFADERAPVIERPAPSGYSLSWWLAMAIVASLAAIVITFGRPA
jgi:hypothetical protein